MSRRLADGIPDPKTAPEPDPVTAVIAIGSNLGDRAAILDAAIAELGRLPLTEDVRVSDPIETVALTLDGPDADAPAYLNAVATVRTRLAPCILLDHLHAIEERHGRASRLPGDLRWQDRTLDLDIVVYGDLVSDDPDLVLPHPRAADRDFVLGPWLAVDPDAVLPGRGRVDLLLERLRAAG